MTRGITIAAIPPQPTRSLKQATLHLRECPSGKRVLYPSANGTVCRALPGEATFQIREIVTCTGNKRPITAAAMTQKVMVAGDEEGHAHIWTKAGSMWLHKTYSLNGMKFVRIADVAVSADSQKAVLVGTDKYSETYGACISTNGGNSVGKIGGQKGGINSADFSPEKPFTIATGGADGSVAIFTGPPYKQTKKIYLKEVYNGVDVGEVTCVRYSPCGSKLAASTSTGMLFVLHAVELTLVCTWVHPGQLFVRSFGWRWSGSHVAVAAKENFVRILELSRPRGLKEVDVITVGQSLEEDEPRGVLFTRCGYIVAACAGGHLKGWKSISNLVEPSDKDLEKELKTRKEASGEDDEEDEANYEKPKTSSSSEISRYNPVGDYDFIWYGPRGGPTCVAFDPISDKLVVGTNLGFLMFLTTESGVPETFQVSKVERDLTIRACIISSKIAVAITQDGLVRFYKVKESNVKSGDGTQRIKKVLEKRKDGKTATTFSSSTRSELSLAATHDTFQVPVACVLIDNGGSVALFLTDGLLNVYSTARALSQARPEQNMIPDWSVKLLGNPECVSVTDDGKLLAVALKPGPDYPPSKFGDDYERIPRHSVVEIYEIESGKSLEAFQFIFVREATSSSITAMALNREGSLLAYAESNFQIWVVEVESQKVLVSTQWETHTQRILGLDWAPDGQRLVSISGSEMFVWNVDKIGAVNEIKTPASSLLFARFLFNNVILSGGTDGVITVTELIEE